MPQNPPHRRPNRRHSAAIPPPDTPGTLAPQPFARPPHICYNPRTYPIGAGRTMPDGLRRAAAPAASAVPPYPAPANPIAAGRSVSAVKVTWDNSSPVEVTLTVEMDAQDETPFLERSYRRAVGRVNIPGFRRGRAPRHVVERMVGRTALLQEAIDYMVPETLNQVLADAQIAAFADPRIEVTELEPAVAFTATIPLEPTVELGDYQALRVAHEPVTIPDERVDHVLTQMQEQQAVWEPVERPAQFGDRLNITVDGTMGDETILTERDVEYIPQHDNVLPFPGFAAHLLGVSEDDDLEFTVTVPEDYPRTRYAGQDVHFTVAVLAVKEKILPDLDDDFARSLDDPYDDLAALRAYVVSSLTEHAEAAARQELEQKSLDALCDVATVNASPLLYERELESLQTDRERMLQQQGLDLPTYLQFMGKSEDEYQAELRPSAERRLIAGLVLRKLAEVEHIEVSEDEVRSEADRLLGASADDATEPENRDAMREFLNTASTLDNIRSSLHTRRVVDRLIEITLGNSADDDAATDSDSAAEDDSAAATRTDSTATDGDNAGNTASPDSSAADGDTPAAASTDSTGANGDNDGNTASPDSSAGDSDTASTDATVTDGNIASPDATATDGDNASDAASPDVSITDGDTAAATASPDTNATDGDNASDAASPDVSVTDRDTAAATANPDANATDGDTAAATASTDGDSAGNNIGADPPDATNSDGDNAGDTATDDAPAETAAAADSDSAANPAPEPQP